MLRGHHRGRGSQPSTSAARFPQIVAHRVEPARRGARELVERGRAKRYAQLSRDGATHPAATTTAPEASTCTSTDPPVAAAIKAPKPVAAMPAASMYTYHKARLAPRDGPAEVEFPMTSPLPHTVGAGPNSD
ncbi:hypothetical protein GCM10010219_63450 [Streptomyces netropsis]|nr:hypothetical protein GCM10010219_63450 [Streptomyces netropsis]